MTSHPTPCIQARELFQNPLVEEPPTGRDDLATRLTGRAIELCESCPLLEQCLYSAVVEHDVAGVAGATTALQRTRIRRLLGVDVGREDLSDFAGTTRERGRLTHADVVRARRADPDATLEIIAERLGCSLSTVKRHLRQARAEAVPAVTPAPRRPTMAAVLAARLSVAGERSRVRAA
jgi:hypothetical protein